MKPTKSTIYRIICCTLLCVSILVCILIIKAIKPGMNTEFLILFASPPILIVLMEICSDIIYFRFDQRQSKIQTFFIILRLICSAVVLLLGSVILFALLLHLPQVNIIPVAFGAAAILLGVSKLMYSVWEIAWYKCNVSERKVIKNLLLAGKLIFSLLVIYMSWMGMILALLSTIPR